MKNTKDVRVYDKDGNCVSATSRNFPQVFFENGLTFYESMIKVLVGELNAIGDTCKKYQDLLARMSESEQFDSEVMETGVCVLTGNYKRYEEAMQNLKDVSKGVDERTKGRLLKELKYTAPDYFYNE